MLKKKNKPAEEPREKHLTLPEAVAHIQEALASTDDEQRAEIFSRATAGVEIAAAHAKRIVRELVEEHLIRVEGMTSMEIAEAAFVELWGLGRIQELYQDPSIDEVRVNPDGRVYVSRRGKNEAVSEVLERGEVEQLIKRMVMHDAGVSLSTGSPLLEAVRLDGSRLTALCSPLTEGFSFALRKHGTVEMTVDNLTRLGTLDEKVWRILSVLVKGRCNILISGPVNSGKTSLLRMLVGELPPGLSIRILDVDNEIRASGRYPDRDILEMEHHPELKVTMRDLFRIILRLSPDVIIVGEFRGAGEALEAIRACVRGHDGSMATAHFSSPEEAVRGTAMLMLEEGLNLSLNQAMVRVAQAFNVVVQTFTDSERGVKKIVGITEIEEDNGAIGYRTLVAWDPFTQDYLGPGKWIVRNAPSRKLCLRMARYGVTPSQVAEVFGVG